MSTNYEFEYQGLGRKINHYIDFDEAMKDDNLTQVLEEFKVFLKALTYSVHDIIPVHDEVEQEMVNSMLRNLREIKNANKKTY